MTKARARARIRQIIAFAPGVGARQREIVRQVLTYGDFFDDLDAEAFESYDAAGVVRQEADGVEAEIRQDLGSESDFVLERRLWHVAVVAEDVAVGGAESLAGGVEVDERANAFFSDAAKRSANEVLAVAGGGT